MNTSKHWIVSTALHTVEVVVVLGFSLVIALKFPDHTLTALGIAFTALTALAAGIRKNPDVPVKDYVNE